MNAEINYWIVCLAALVYFTGGVIWYSPLLFGKIWMRLLSGKDEKIEYNKRMWIITIAGFISAFIISYTLAFIIHFRQADTFMEGISTGFICWLGFVIATNMMNTLLANGSYKLLAIHCGFQLYGLLVMGSILSV